MPDGTPYGTTLHPSKKVSGPDGYEPNQDGKIKDAPSGWLQIFDIITEYATALANAGWLCLRQTRRNLTKMATAVCPEGSRDPCQATHRLS